MSNAVDQLLQTALTLSESEQLELVAALVSAVDERQLRPFDDHWLHEIQRRSLEFDAGGVNTSTWSEVKLRARQGDASSA